MEAFDKLKALMAAAEEEVLKVDAGNKAAGTRLRKQMQEIKKACHDLRQAVLELREKPAE